MHLQQTDRLALAARFINSTSSHLFVTGKAGTGKTTFLKQLAAQTHKSHIIVAPTGIAALNAEGVTIHSQFLFPFGSFLPVREPPQTFTENAYFYTKHTLSRKHTLNSLRRKVLRATELLIIDEVSMLRADLLDAIDYRMRSAKGNYAKSFGGAQVLMIGDLHQLPPIVKEDEWMQLKTYYRSMHFFEAQVFRDDPMVSIELDKIFRQSDEDFIGILNRLRNKASSAADIARLNSHYRSKEEIDPLEGIITLATHNRMADGINMGKLDELPGAVVRYEAKITGDFPEKLYPLPLQIELKEGAQVMFIRNDSDEEKRYYNGKLARVEHLDEEEVVVLMPDSGEEFTLHRETWEHKKYTLNEEHKEIEEEVVGTFEQYPVKLAWAVTVHKSQGLTFEKAIIDVGQAFAPGQVYVALSRLRSLDGLILRTRIPASVIMSDPDVQAFNRQMEQQPPLSELLQEKQRVYLGQYLGATFDFSTLIRQLEKAEELRSEKMKFEVEGMQLALKKLLKRFEGETGHTRNFRHQLQGLLRQNNPELLLERIEKGSRYYQDFLDENLKQLLHHLAEVERMTRTKTYRNALSEVDQQLMIALTRLEQVAYLTERILAGQPITRAEITYQACSERRSELWEEAQQAAKENPLLKKAKKAKGGKGTRGGKGDRKRKKPANPG